MKNIFLMICGLLLLNFSANAQQKISVIGKVLDEDKNPLIGAIVQNLNQSVSTAEDGTFKLDLRKGVATISISYVGYVKQKFDVNVAEAMKPLIFILKSSLTSLQEVEISTGYQKMPKERATGSFEFVGKESLNRIVSTNIVDRLQNVASGLVFNKDQSVVNGASPISIRGQNTIFANAKPLIVIDNFPYEGDLLNINPNDVESLTI
ncbi:MAG TPA: carboxypeptidase-like regulatory domain-containing protein, partial [Pedobacter sp.]|nr:carboxypeptidase-like regulatory domain-containing protein [Pedobacter sp.]